MNATMLPPLGDPFIPLSQACDKSRHKLLRISFSLWERLECTQRDRFARSQWKQDGLVLGSEFAQTIYGVPTLVDLALLGDSYLLEAA